jgi:hypothetical protein
MAATEQEPSVGEEAGVGVMLQLRTARRRSPPGKRGRPRRLGGDHRQARNGKKSDEAESDQITDDVYRTILSSIAYMPLFER